MKKRNFGGLNKQYQSNVARKDDYSSSSGANNHLFNKGVIGTRKFLSLKDGESAIIKFVPYEVDATHPCVMDKSMDVGDLAYVLSYDQHCFGKDFTMVICPHGTYGEPCPICEKAQEMRDEGDDSESMKKAISDIRARRRVLYNVLVIKKDKDMNKDFSQTFLLSESQFLFEKPMITELKKGDPDLDFTEYNINQFCVGGVEDIRDARCLKVGCNGKGLNKEFTFTVLKEKAEWAERYDVDDLIDNAVPLHKAINHLSYGELETLMNGASMTSVEDDDDDEDDDDEREAMRRPSRKVPRQESDFPDDSVPFDSKKTKAESEEEDVDTEEDDDDGTEEDVTDHDSDGRQECPYGHKFGVDAFTTTDCRGCECMDKCYAMMNE